MNSETLLNEVLSSLEKTHPGYFLRIQEVNKDGKTVSMFGTRRVHATILRDDKPVFFAKAETTDMWTPIEKMREDCLTRLLKIILISGILTQSGLKDD